MNNFFQISKLSFDQVTSKPILEARYTQLRKEIFVGSLYWYSSAKDKDTQKSLTGSLRFYTWEKSIYDLFLRNPKETFLVKGELIPNFFEKNGVKRKGFELCINEASIYRKSDEPLKKHYQEVD